MPMTNRNIHNIRVVGGLLLTGESTWVQQRQAKSGQSLPNNCDTISGVLVDEHPSAAFASKEGRYSSAKVKGDNGGGGGGQGTSPSTSRLDNKSNISR